jgi:phosphonate transport system substrate-binding protein
MYGVEPRGLAPWRLLISLAMAAVISAFVAFSGPAAFAAESLRIVIGRISEKPRDHFARMRSLADYLAAEMAADGVTGVDVVLVDDLDEMRQLMASGRVDMISETAFMALELEEAGVAELMLREWKHGVAEYHSIFFARADSGLEDLDDLAGRIVAFEDPGSTSAYLVPRATLERSGVDLVSLDQPGDPVPDGEVGYVFADGEANVVAWVHRGLADAGVVSNLDWVNEDEAPPFLRDDLVILHETPPIIRSLLLMRTGLAPELKSRLAEILRGMHESEAGRRALLRYFSVSRFDLIDEDVMERFESVRELRRFLQQ